ncbi:MAG: aromatic ring-hydroxylating dioxygenase subunit alpha [Cyanobacteria bacterium P01_F01_bin.150]
MELATKLKSTTVRNVVRTVGINPNYWYPLGWSSELNPGQVKSVTVWEQSIAIYRDSTGTLYALENRCPHRGIELHLGKVKDDHLACAYHGWEFDGATGDCVNIPYFDENRKMPRCAVTKSYPVQEKFGLMWVFPGDPDLADSKPLPEVPEFDNSEWFMVPITAHFKAHFSVCNENAMDVFHGFLHEELQGWFDPILLDLKSTDSSIRAKYQVSYKGIMAKFLGLSERADEVTTLPITINYNYPHYASSLQGVSSVYLMRLPVGPQESRSFALFFFRLGLPKWLVKPLNPLLKRVVPRLMLQPFLDQDIEMMENEQIQYAKDPEQRYVEINPAIIALQKVIVRQYESFVQQSNQSSEKPLRSAKRDQSGSRPSNQSRSKLVV